MIKIKTVVLAIFSLAMIGLISCEKETTLRSPTLQLVFDTKTSSTSLKNTLANNIEFTDGRIILENISFEAESDTDSIQLEFEINAFITIDFATGEITPDVSAIEILPGYYTEIELEFELWDQTEQPSIYLEGTYTDTNGTPHPVRLIMPVGQTFSLEIEGQFNIQEHTSMIALITIDPGAWFIGKAGELLSSATTNSEGVIVISPDHNYAIYDLVKDAIDDMSEIEIEIYEHQKSQ